MRDLTFCPSDNHNATIFCAKYLESKVNKFLIKSENQNTWEKQTEILSDDFKGPLKFGSAYFLARFAYYLQRLSKYFKKVQN